ncbi:MAG: hypothetical protein JXQ73_31075 [Phycisphaerae bacterium]|nr:hypothetical protein [Phycisphaerae bacterium]
MCEIIDRLRWYCQVANCVAWAVQYRKEPDLFGDIDEPAQVTERLAETQRLRQYIGRIRYNLATNDGNVFLEEKWRGLLDDLADALAVEQLERMGC